MSSRPAAAIVAGAAVDKGRDVVTDDEETNQFDGKAVVDITPTAVVAGAAEDEGETNQFVGNAVVDALPADSAVTAVAIAAGSAVAVPLVSATVVGSAGCDIVRGGGVDSPCLAEHPATFRRSMQTCCS